MNTIDDASARRPAYLRRHSTLRKALLFVVAVAMLGFAVFWFVTISSTVAASALAPHTPDLANGKTMFLAGDCSSCHAVPMQEDSTRLGGGLGLVA